MVLAQSDAEAFERKRRALIEQELSKAPPALQERLRRLQWRIDMERQRHKHPLSSCIHIFEMMWDQVYGEGGLLDVLNRVAGSDPLPRPLKRSAQILPFARSKQDSA